ncbi:hypothetical protein [Bifidobacterium olomucense]|uniref:Phosphoenolpyruvate synthase n=1 Tax=Bifidobacterium olomucense TaxID=2675324 RepID=A0A7Y0HYH1_9BIFI|nr:hypothetical protein [Bifidobacterium sp. DSM 109959]NMM99332.1 phosphoenolpyruvate synthase [Bifidobacterium sp. DSM 109959]
MALNKQVQFVHQDKTEPGQIIEQVAVFDADGNPVDITAGGGSSVTSVKATGLAAGATPTAALADGVLTLGIPAGATGPAGPAGAAGARGATGPAGPAGVAGAAGKSVTGLALTTDASGKVTGGTVTFSDKTTAAITVTTATA